MGQKAEEKETSKRKNKLRVEDMDNKTKVMEDKKRCEWCLGSDIYMDYHDNEWGVPVHDDRLHFEFLILEGAQAGLSWLTILKRRENYRKAYDNFDPEIVATYGEEKIEELMNDEGIIRNRRKVESSVKNARAFLEVQQEFGSFDAYIWSFTNGETICIGYDDMKDMPAKTELSEKSSSDLKKRGFSFVGPTIIYANLQATGIVNDHEKSCYRYKELNGK